VESRIKGSGELWRFGPECVATNEGLYSPCPAQSQSRTGESEFRKWGVGLRFEGRYKTTWKRGFKLPWLKAGLLKSSG